MVQLLVSVRSADEVGPALAGGADIIDAKEPARGSLGAVSRAELGRILASVPARCPISIALGDLTAVADVGVALDGLDVGTRAGPVYLKLGFAGVRATARIQTMIENAGRLGANISRAIRVVAVAYADADRADTVTPALVLQLAGSAGAAGVLLDTHVKDGRRLLDWLDPSALRTWVTAARESGLVAALAGALEPTDFELMYGIGPDVVGVRGAACEGGREGLVTAERVSALRQALRHSNREMAVGKSS
ncbi:MAG: (5-formylfuran-3-yl)methyl phosphate synthase [Gemmatimonadales bacterium]